jgi:hypothetical protein
MSLGWMNERWQHGGIEQDSSAKEFSRLSLSKVNSP